MPHSNYCLTEKLIIMEGKEILTAQQFVDAVREECGISVDLKDVCIGRLDFISHENRKDSGYICFWYQADGKFLCLKAFKGKTERKVKVVNSKDVIIKRNFYRRDAFASAYKATKWKIVPDGDNFYLITMDEYDMRMRAAARAKG